MTKLAVTARLVSAHATCLDCRFEAWGQEVKTATAAHVEESGHTVDINANTMTTIAPGRADEEG